MFDLPQRTHQRCVPLQQRLNITNQARDYRLKLSSAFDAVFSFGQISFFHPSTPRIADYIFTGSAPLNVPHSRCPK